MGDKCAGISESFVSIHKTKPSHMLVRNYCQGFGFIFGLKWLGPIFVSTVSGVMRLIAKLLMVRLARESTKPLVLSLVFVSRVAPASEESPSLGLLWMVWIARAPRETGSGLDSNDMHMIKRPTSWLPEEPTRGKRLLQKCYSGGTSEETGLPQGADGQRGLTDGILQCGLQVEW